MERDGTMTDMQVIQQCAAILQRHYGDKFRGLVLYGSLARHEETPESDIDLLVLLDPPFDFFGELYRIIGLLYPLQLESDRLISALPARLDEFERGAVQLYRNAKEEGVLVA